jgi:hypothetical protein
LGFDEARYVIAAGICQFSPRFSKAAQAVA